MALWHEGPQCEQRYFSLFALWPPPLSTSLDSGAEVVVSDASVPWRGGMQSTSWSEGLELCYREQDQNYQGKFKKQTALMIPYSNLLSLTSHTSALQGQQARGFSYSRLPCLYRKTANVCSRFLDPQGPVINGLPCLLSTFRPLWAPKLANYSLQLPAFNVETWCSYPSLCYDDPVDFSSVSLHVLNYLNCPHHTCLEPGAWSLGLLIQGLVGTSKWDIYIYIICFSFSGPGFRDKPERLVLSGNRCWSLSHLDKTFKVWKLNISFLVLSSLTWMTGKISADRDQLW